MRRLIQIILLGIASRAAKASIMLQNESVLECIECIDAVDKMKILIEKRIDLEVEFEEFYTRAKKAWLKPL